MKTTAKLFIIILLSCVTGMVTAQDVILKKDNSTILSKVLEVNNTEIKYKKWSNLDGPTYSITRSEVTSISYQNGEVEKFSDNASEPTQTNAGNTQQTSTQYNGYMDHKGENLTMDGRILFDSEVRNLVDEQTYQRYLEIKNRAKIQYGFGIALASIGTVSMLAGSVLSESQPDTALKLLLGGIVVATPGLILGLTAGSKLNPIAEEYNRNHGNSYTLNISPSLMQCEMLPTQGNCGAGLTFSLNFN